MTSQFESAARLMARVLGAERYPFVVIEHPISSASQRELAERARQALDQSVDIVLADAGP